MPFLAFLFVIWSIHTALVYLHGWVHTWQLWVIGIPIGMFGIFLVGWVIHLAVKFSRKRKKNIEKENLLRELAFWNDETYTEAALRFKKQNALNLRNELHKLNKGNL